MLEEAAILAGGGLLSSILGNRASSKAAAQQAAAQIYNTQMQQNENMLQRAMVDRIIADQKLGSTDEQGNRTYFAPGRGWVTELSSQSKALADAILAAQLERATTEEQRRQSEAALGYKRRLSEGQTANTLLDEFNRSGQLTPQETFLDLSNTATRGINRAYDMQENTIANRMARMNTQPSSVAEVMARMAAERSKDVTAATPSRTDAIERTLGINTNERNAVGNLYNLFAGRASAQQPDSLPAANYSDRAGTAASGAAGQQIYGSMAAKGQAPTLDPRYMGPDYGKANVAAGAADLLSTFFKSAQGANTTGIDPNRTAQYNGSLYDELMTMNNAKNPIPSSVL